MATKGILLLLLVFATGVFCQQDRTVIKGESGPDVVQAVLAKLQYSNIFPSNSDMRETIFMQRMAYVETRDGTEPPRFPTTSNNTGGIWNVSPRIFQSTLTQTSIIQSISGSRLLNYVNWTAESQVNLSLPLYSGIAIRIYLSTLQSVPSPGSTSRLEQQTFWIQHFHQENQTAITAMNTWINDLNALGENEGCTFTTDTVFVLDTSGSIGAPNFEEVRTFTRDFADTLLRNETDTSNNRIGIVLFQSQATVTFALDSQVTPKQQLLQLIENLPYSGGGTNTADGLDNMRLQAWRSEISTVRLAVVLTDGKSNDFSATIEAARKVHQHEPGILVFAIGVGNGPNMEELREIASGPEFVATLASFDQTLFSATVASFSYRICNTVSQNVSTNSSQTGEIQGNSTVRLSYTQPASDEGITLQLCAHSGTLMLYASTTIPNPSSALYDFVITVKAVPHYLSCNATFLNFTLIAPDGRGTITLFITLKGGSKFNNFTLNSDEGFLPDEDECEGEHPCHNDGECINIYGGFFCQCGSGYFGDGVVNCTDVDECKEIDEPCTGNHICVNTVGDYTCTLDPTILIIIIICASAGLALMCIAPIIIAVTCYYYQRRKGDMKHSSSFDNLIANDVLEDETVDVDENMYIHLKQEEIIQEDDDKDKNLSRTLGSDIERRIKMLHGEEDSIQTKKESGVIAVTFIDDVDVGGGKKKDLSYIDDVEDDKKPKNELKDKWKSAKQKSEEITDVSYIDDVEDDKKPKNELKDKWKSAKQKSEEITDVSYIDEVDHESDTDKMKLLQKLSDKKPGLSKMSGGEDKKEDLSHVSDVYTDTTTNLKGQNNRSLPAKPSTNDKDRFKHKTVETDIQRRIRELQGKGAQ